MDGGRRGEASPKAAGASQAAARRARIPTARVRLRGSAVARRCTAGSAARGAMCRVEEVEFRLQGVSSHCVFSGTRRPRQRGPAPSPEAVVVRVRGCALARGRRGPEGMGARVVGSGDEFVDEVRDRKPQARGRRRAQARAFAYNLRRKPPVGGFLLKGLYLAVQLVAVVAYRARRKSSFDARAY